MGKVFITQLPMVERGNAVQENGPEIRPPLKEVSNTREAILPSPSTFGVENYTDAMITKIQTLKTSLIKNVQQPPTPASVRQLLQTRPKEEIRALQYHLACKDSYVSLGNSGPGNKGVDGIIGEKTLLTLIGDRAIQYIKDQIAQGKNVASLPLNQWNGPTMKALQQFLSAHSIRLAHDGLYGNQTQLAINLFLSQQQLNQQESGEKQKVVQVTRNELNDREKVITGWNIGPKNNPTNQAPITTTQKLEYGPQEYDIVEDIIQNFAQKVSIPWRSIEKGEVTETMKLVEQYYTLQQPPFTDITLSDVYALICYESNFQHEQSNGRVTKSYSGSTGLMQLTTIAFANLKAQKNAPGYNQEYLQQQFQEYGVDYAAVRDGMRKNEDGTWQFARGPNERNKIFGNKALNIIVGLATLKLKENSGITKTTKEVFSNASLKQAIQKRTKEVLVNNRGIIVNDKKLTQLVQQLGTDDKLQRKFATFARYNGETRGNPQNRWVYALSVLYMGADIFVPSQAGR